MSVQPRIKGTYCNWSSLSLNYGVQCVVCLFVCSDTFCGHVWLYYSRCGPPILGMNPSCLRLRMLRLYMSLMAKWLSPKVDTPLFATNANPLQLYHSPREKILGLKDNDISGTWSVLFLIWRSWVWTPIGSNLGSVVLLSQSYFNQKDKSYGFWRYIGWVQIE